MNVNLYVLGFRVDVKRKSINNKVRREVLDVVEALDIENSRASSFQMRGIHVVETKTLLEVINNKVVNVLQEKDELEYAVTLDEEAKQEKIYYMIIDGGSCENLVSMALVKAFNLPTEPHPSPYQIGQRLVLMVTKICKVPLAMGKHYNDLVSDIVDIGTCHVLLGRPWQHDVDYTWPSTDGYCKIVIFAGCLSLQILPENYDPTDLYEVGQAILVYMSKGKRNPSPDKTLLLKGQFDNWKIAGTHKEVWDLLQKLHDVNPEQGVSSVGFSLDSADCDLTKYFNTKILCKYHEIFMQKNGVDDFVEIPFDDEAWAEATCFTKKNKGYGFGLTKQAERIYRKVKRTKKSRAYNSRSDEAWIESEVVSTYGSI
nr:Asp_protease_2 domain-containing protein [Tanacetum cinerariifolium]